MKHGIRNGTGDKAMGKDDKPGKDNGEQEAVGKGKKLLQKKKAVAFGKVKT